MAKTLAVGVVGVLTWMYIAPKVWPNHILLATFLITAAASLLIGVLSLKKD